LTLGDSGLSSAWMVSRISSNLFGIIGSAVDDGRTEIGRLLGTLPPTVPLPTDEPIRPGRGRQMNIPLDGHSANVSLFVALNSCLLLVALLLLLLLLLSFILFIIFCLIATVALIIASFQLCAVVGVVFGGVVLFVIILLLFATILPVFVLAFVFAAKIDGFFVSDEAVNITVDAVFAVSVSFVDDDDVFVCCVVPGTALSQAR